MGKGDYGAYIGMHTKMKRKSVPNACCSLGCLKSGSPVFKSVAGDRAQFTKSVVAHLVESIHKNNAMASGDYVMQKVTFDSGFWGGGSYTFNMYVAPPGHKFQVTNTGDGGFINWSFGGRFDRTGSNNHWCCQVLLSCTVRLLALVDGQYQMWSTVKNSWALVIVWLQAIGRCGIKLLSMAWCYQNVGHVCNKWSWSEQSCTIWIVCGQPWKVTVCSNLGFYILVLMQTQWRIVYLK